MNKIKITGAALAISAAAMFSMAPAHASSSDAGSTMVQCAGVNSCKGQGSCKTANNSCKGQNSCKGKGNMTMTKEDCQKAGGTEDTSSSTGSSS